MTRWKLVPCEPENAMLEAMWGIPPASQDDAMMMVDDYKRLLSASPSPGEDEIQQIARRCCKKENGFDRCACANNNAGACRGRMETVRAVLAALEGSDGPS